jgi:NAD(P)-dependent dehydrogenase (short-subunit alcohol dehydrogenase family)
LITGAASGLGRALAVRLARDGWHIAVCDVDNAGEVGRFPLDDWRWILDVNLFGVIHGCHCFPFFSYSFVHERHPRSIP